MEEQELKPLDPELERIKLHKESALNWRERRHDDWTENYTLYRDKVTINRLIQRQSVNIPLMKQVVKTLLKDMDDPPLLYFDNLDNDKQKEIFYNVYWDKTAEQNRLVVKDIVDKKQVLLYGRTFKKLNIVDGKFFFEVIDPWDILTDRYIDPANLDSARFLSHIHIFKPLSSLDSNPEYDEEAIARLYVYYSSEEGMQKAQENAEALRERNDRMREMGVTDVDNPILGETYVELNENYVWIYDEDKGEDVLRLIVTADDEEKLLSKPLEEVIGKTKDNYWRDHLPYTSWADDVERSDFWSDGVGDIIRTPNKVLNSWMSQLVENRTLRNFGMHYYDATQEGFAPQTFEPVPWGWYPVPGRPADVLQKVEIPDLSESLDEMNFLITMIEKATAATTTQQGAIAERNVTLGEIQLTLAEAKERVHSIAIMYNESWKEFGQKYVKMVEANEDKLDAVTLFKKGYKGNMFSKEIEPKSWISKSGYEVKVMSRAEKGAKDVEDIQKLNAVKNSMPDNQPLDEIYKKKLLEFAELNPDEIQEVLKFEKEKQSRIPELTATAGGTQPQMMAGSVPTQPMVTA
jgi:hypothetical protein